MKITCDEFRRCPNKTITLLGMSGIGKTTLAKILPADQWFHYSGDYRIGTRYLNEAIRDSIKCEAMKHKMFRDLFRRDLIYLRNNISIDNVQIISHFLGIVGNADLGGLGVDEFKRRQKLFRAAEVNAMCDVDEFIVKARTIYGYPNFINDTGGSICELHSHECWDFLSRKTVVLYLRADEDLESMLMERARMYPKPMYYEESFFDQHLAEFLERKNFKSIDEIIPNEFTQWIFPRLIAWRRPLYEKFAEQYGYTIDAKQISTLRDEADFIELVCTAINGK